MICTSFRAPRLAMPRLSCWVLVALAFTSAAANATICTLRAQSATTGRADAGDSLQGRRRIQPFPALGSSPETGLQLGVTVLAVYEQPTASRARPASLVATAVRSTKAQTRVSLEGEHWTRANARRLQALVAWQKFPLPYYGIGHNAPETQKVVYTPTSVEVAGTVQQRVRGAWYGVVGARMLDQDIARDSASDVLRQQQVLGSSGGRVAEVTVGVLRDSRDFVFNPSAGTFAQLSYAVSRDGAASDFSYERLRLDARRYTSLGDGHVLATQLLVVGTTGGAPFDQLALVGGGDIMRGYTRGRYRDAWLSAAQLEYRSPIRRRLGLVAFAGAGSVAAESNALWSTTVLPTYGAGVRVQIDARQRTAVRVDIGRGRQSTGLYIGFNQAF